MHRIGIALIALLCASAARAQPLPTVTVPAEIQQVLDAYAEAWTRKDTRALAALFSEDGMALPNMQPPARGADAIEKTYAQGAGSPLSLRPIAYGRSGELAYVIGGFGPTPEAPEFGKFTLLLRLQPDGQWRIVSDMDNSNAPMGPPPQVRRKPAQY